MLSTCPPTTRGRHLFHASSTCTFPSTTLKRMNPMHAPHACGSHGLWSHQATLPLAPHAPSSRLRPVAAAIAAAVLRCLSMRTPPQHAVRYRRNIGEAPRAGDPLNSDSDLKHARRPRTRDRRPAAAPRAHRSSH